MYDSKARFQYARLPRFSTMDPLMELDYATSPYTYCRNDFVNLTDPTGLYATWLEAYHASREHPNSYLGRDWTTGNYFFSYRLDSDDYVLAHREFGPEGNPNTYGRPNTGRFPYTSSYYRYDPWPGGGGSGKKQTAATLLANINSSVATATESLQTQPFRYAAVSHMMTEKASGNTLVTKGINNVVSNYTVVQALNKSSTAIGVYIIIKDTHKAYQQDGYWTSYNTVRTGATGAAGIIGGSYGAYYGATFGAEIGALFGGVGAVPGAIIGGVVGGVGGSFFSEWMAGSTIDAIYNQP